MKKYFSLFLLFLVCSILSAQMTVSGILDTTVSMNAGAGDAPAFSCGFEEYANIRFQSKLRERGTVYGAINLFAATGDYAEGLVMAGANPVGDNFVSAIELERLYFRLNGEHTDLDCGLFRLPFGYGQVWGPSDFINPKNPLKPDARPRAIPGAALSWYPNDDLKILGFTAGPRDPFSQNAEGWLMGIASDRHWEKVSVQALYSYEMPQPAAETVETAALFPPVSSEYGVHRFGLSVKVDLEAGFVIDALYTYNHEEDADMIDGLSFSIGADYSLLGGDLIVLAEYLYNGKTSATALGYGGNFTNNNYLYTGLTYRFNDFTNMSAALISSLDDISFTPVLVLNHELFQGATLTFTAQVPLDRDLFSGDGNRGELGPNYSYFNCSTRIRLRF